MDKMQTRLLNFRVVSSSLTEKMKPAPTTMFPLLLLHLFFLLPSPSTSSPLTKTDCTTHCGKVDIPYPFGMGTDCFWPGFEIICNMSSPPTPFLAMSEFLEVVSVSLSTGELRVSPIFNMTLAFNLFNRSGKVVMVSDWAIGDKSCEEALRNSSSGMLCGSNAECYNSDNGPGYRCNCSPGFEGNPYILDGCQGRGVLSFWFNRHAPRFKNTF